MIRRIGLLLTGILTSLFVFPFNLPITLAVNTKMIVAVFGLILFGFDKAMNKTLALSREFIVLSGICILISIWAFGVTVFNRTGDMTFATYLISVWVWLGAAYAVVWMIKNVHGQLTIELIGNYLIAVSVVQCVLAYLMTLIPSLKVLVDGMMGDSDMYMGVAEGRLYGLGAALDPSGLRFSGVLVITTHLIHKTDFENNPVKGLLYILSFIIIAVIGNMIARSTTIGLAVATIYLIISLIKGDKIPNRASFWRLFTPVLLVVIILSVWLYNTNKQFRDNFRFGFEGFVSLVEKGHWEVSSNKTLEGMIVWPESLKTWTIGDGYFDSPQDLPNIFGRTSEGFYMKTDIGYLRYIYYFGIIGLIGMIAALIYMTFTCCKAMKDHILLFISLLLITLIGWIKVSSDIIMVFAPFLILAYLSEPSESDDPKCESATSPSVEKKKERHLHQWQ